MLRSREVKQTGPGQQVSWLSFGPGSPFSQSSHLSSAAASEDCHSQRRGTWRFHDWGCWSAALLTHLFHRLHQTPKARCPCRHSFSGNAAALQSVGWGSTNSGITKVQISLWTATPLLFGVPSSHRLRHYHLLWLQGTLKADEGSFYVVNCSSNICVYGEHLGTGVHWFWFPSTFIFWSLEQHS